MSLIKLFVQEHCKATGREKHVDEIEKALRNARDMWPSRGSTYMDSLLRKYFAYCNKARPCEMK